MKKAALATAALSILTIAACRTGTVPAPISVAPSAAQNTTSDDYVVIGSFARRDQVVTIKTGPDGIVYSVAGKDGRIQYENLTAAQFKEKSPELHEYVSTGTALWGGLLRPRPTIDAGLRIER